MRVATVDKIVGRRLRLTYTDAAAGELGFWCHEESSLIHPVGWSVSVGHSIQASTGYLERCQKKLSLPTDSTGEQFNELKNLQASSNWTKFREGMKLEAVDPLNLDNICVATIVKVLRQGFLMIQIDRNVSTGTGRTNAAQDHDSSASNFCYHCSSACIAPAGFCEANAIALKPPHDYAGRFRWGDYLRQTKAQSAPDSLFLKVKS